MTAIRARNALFAARRWHHTCAGSFSRHLSRRARDKVCFMDENPESGSSGFRELLRPRETANAIFRRGVAQKREIYARNVTGIRRERPAAIFFRRRFPRCTCFTLTKVRPISAARMQMQFATTRVWIFLVLRLTNKCNSFEIHFNSKSF